MKNNSGWFKKGSIPWSKGTKGKVVANSGSFKKGMTTWNKGIPMKAESKLKESMSKKNKPAKFIKVSKEERFSKILKNRMSEPEKRLLSWITEEKLPINYTGNGKIWIKGIIGQYGNDEIYNPDFMTHDNKTIIEVDSRWRKTNKVLAEKTKRRNELYISQGYQLILIDETDVKSGKGKLLTLNKLKEVLSNGMV